MGTLSGVIIVLATWSIFQRFSRRHSLSPAGGGVALANRGAPTTEL